MTWRDDDAIIACADLVGRTGAREFQIGYVHDDVPVHEAGWFAHATYQGARITEDDHRGPVEAADALCRRLLTGARCTHCNGLVALSDSGAVAYGGRMADGTVFTHEQAKAARQCRWRRMGPKWVRGCETT
jgi:hypothetical protein